MAQKKHEGEVLLVLTDHAEQHLVKRGRDRWRDQDEILSGIRNVRVVLDFGRGMTHIASVAIDHQTVTMSDVTFFKLRTQYDRSWKVTCVECNREL